MATSPVNDNIDADCSLKIQQRTVTFHGQFGDDISPSLVLRILDCQARAAPTEVWLCFSLVFPKVYELMLSLGSRARHLDDVLYAHMSGNFETDIWGDLKSRTEYGTWLYYFRSLASRDIAYQEWLDKVSEARDSIETCQQAVFLAQTELSSIDTTYSMVHSYSRILKNVEDCFTSGLEHLAERMNVKKSEHEALKAPSISGSSGKHLLQPVAALPNSSSKTRLQQLLDRWFLRTGRQNNSLPLPNTTRNYAPIQQTRDKMRARKLKANQLLGHIVSVCIIVAIGFIASVVLTAFAVLEAESSNSGTSFKPPIIDSNFYSTVSQTIIGVLGIFTIMIPILRRDRDTQPEIPVSWPIFFYMLLVLSFMTLATSSAVYPWQAIASIIIAFVGTAFQLLANLLIIIGATTTITNNVQVIREQDMVIGEQDEIIDELRR